VRAGGGGKSKISVMPVDENNNSTIASADMPAVLVIHF
jgi:hypothetical protein